MSKALYAKVGLPVTAVILVLAIVALAQPNASKRALNTGSPTTGDGGDQGGSSGDSGDEIGAPAPSEITTSKTTGASSPAARAFSPATSAERTDGPPDEGNYLYHVKTGFDGGEPKERDQTFEVRNAAPSGGEQARQFVEFLGGRAEVSWRTEGVYLLAVEGGSGGFAFKCDFEPDVLSLKFPLTVESTWSSESSCDFESNGQKGKVVMAAKTTVTGMETLVIEGTKVQTFVIKRTQKSTVTFGVQTYTEESESTENFARKYGLIVKSSSKSTSTGPDGRKFNAFADLQLLKLKPTQ